MRNLQLSTSSLVSDDVLRNVRLFSLDPDSNNCFCVTENSLHLLTSHSQHVYATNVDVYCDLNISSKQIISVDYLNDQQAVSLVTESGDLILHSDDKFETIGSVESGFKAASWSPDGDILILITGHETILAMTREFEPIKEVPLFSDHFGEGKPVTVGWGKKETQFDGSNGKETAKVVNTGLKSEVRVSEDGKSRLSWRGDGQLFAVNVISPKTGERNIYIFSRDCTLMYSSESILGLESQISWKPNGSVIAAAQRLPNKHQVIFLEKNGLRHGEFVISSSADEYTIRQLCWNCDSSLLAVWVVEFEKDESAKSSSCSKLQIWTVNNYHWYLKQTLDFPIENRLTCFAWHPENALILHCFTEAGTFICYSWEWVTNCSMDSTQVDDAVVGVIDSNKILVTPFRQMIVPPPQSAYEIILPCPANHICFPRNHSAGKFAIILADNRMVVVDKGDNYSEKSLKLNACSGQGFNCHLIPHSVAASYKLNLPIDDKKQIHKFLDKKQVLLPLNFCNWLWLTPESVINIRNVDGSSLLMRFSLNESSHQLEFQGLTKVNGIVRTLTATTKLSTVIAQLSDGSILECVVNNDDFIINPWVLNDDTVFRFPQLCHTVKTCCVSDQELIFGLSHRQRLYCLNNELFSSCTSFILHDDFILTTTNDHVLHAIPLSGILLSKSDDSHGESLRRLERGSRIVTCVKNGTQLVLQMPRGNLEGIHPRALVLSMVSKYLDELNFIDAFVLMKKHRINMNLLFDHNPKKFLENVDKFITQINNVNWINLFLTDLRAENVTITLYKSSYFNTSEIGFPDKVNSVHSAVRRALMEADSQKFLLSILTTHVMSEPPRLETALNLIKNLDMGTKDEALSYMQYLTDINDLYDVALGTYDFDLVIMVSQKSQKDPKEYLPTLNRLRKMELNYQKFNIDCKLQKYEKALGHIIKCADRFDECLQHVSTHNLHRQALQLVFSNKEKYQKIALLYAQHLNSIKKYNEAGLWFERGGNLHSAVDAYQNGLQWMKALTLATDIPLFPNEIWILAAKLAGRLKDERRYSECSHIHEHYLNSATDSILTLIEGRQWQLAYEMIYRHNRKDVIETHMKIGVHDHCKSLIANIIQKEMLLNQYASRLQVVRQEKRNKLLQTNDNVDNDLASDVESTITWSTQQSSRSCSSRMTSRNRRKQERKKQSLKKGNPFEENALIEACNEIYVEGDKMAEECASVLWFSLSLGFDQDAEELQNKYGEFLQLMKKYKDDIWSLSEQLLTGNTLQMGPDSTANSIVESSLLVKNMTTETKSIGPTLRDNVKWKLDCFL